MRRSARPNGGWRRWSRTERSDCGWDALRGRIWDGCIRCVGKRLAIDATFVGVVVVDSYDHFGLGEADEGAEPVRIPAAIAIEPAAWSHVRAKGLVPCGFPHGRRVIVVIKAVMWVRSVMC